MRVKIRDSRKLKVLERRGVRSEKMRADIRQYAKELAMRPYSEVVFRDRTTDDEYIYVAITPELDGCMAQGETIREARENLRLFRVDYIQHLLEHNLSVPGPAWMATTTEADSITLPTEAFREPDGELLEAGSQSKHRERLFEVRLRIENDLVKHG